MIQPLCEPFVVADTACFVKQKPVFDEVCLTLVAPEWPRVPWFHLFRRVAERKFRVDGPVYLTEDGNVRQAPRWATVIAVVDCAHY